MSEQLKFYKGNEADLNGLTLIPGALYHCLDTGNTYLATGTSTKQLFATTNSGVTKTTIVKWDGVQ